MVRAEELGNAGIVGWAGELKTVLVEGARTKTAFGAFAVLHRVQVCYSMVRFVLLWMGLGGIGGMGTHSVAWDV